MRGDMITAVNGTSVSSKSDIETALKDSKVGDTVTLLPLQEEVRLQISSSLLQNIHRAAVLQQAIQKTQNKSSQSQGKSSDNSDNDSIWNYMFGQ